MKIRHIIGFFLAAVMLLDLCACGSAPQPEVSALPVPEASATPSPTPTPTPEPTLEPPPPFPPDDAPELTEAPSLLVVLDPGHQAKADLAPEPIGPGAVETKYRVSGGTYGAASGLAEHELVLTVCLLLRDELTARGYEVVLTRDRADVQLSNAERAAIANELHADAFLRIHANGSTNPDANGALSICMTPANPYNAALYPDSYALSTAVLDAYIAATGARREQVWETDTMSGINWSQVPVTILELGYMTNREEDLRMASPAYQDLMVQGIADGLDAFFGREEPSSPPTLQSDMEAALAQLSGRWDVWMEPFDGSAAVHVTKGIAPDEPLVSASLIKLFIMAAVYERIHLGEANESELIGLLRPMITVSDNNAANRLTSLLGGGDADAGMWAVNDWAARQGYSGVSHRRLMLADNGLQNYVTAEACARLLRAIYGGTCVSADASASMLELLKAQQVNDRIPAALPAGTVCAHKTGNLAGLCVADVGIVFSPGGDYVLCAICNNPYSDMEATSGIVKLSNLAWDYMNR